MKALSICFALLAGAASAQQATEASGGVLRLLDKTTGELTDLNMVAGQSETFGLLTVTLRECRYPAGNPSGDAYAALTVTYDGTSKPVFEGWMIASSPALNPMDHPRYDVWVLRCKTS